MTATRPSISDVPKKIPYKETFLLGTDLPDDIELKNLKGKLLFSSLLYLIHSADHDMSFNSFPRGSGFRNTLCPHE